MPTVFVDVAPPPERPTPREMASAAEAQAKAGARPAASAAPCKGTVVSTHSWSELGITDPAALQQREALVSDGGQWQQVSVPAGADTMLEDVAATQNGFVIVEQATNRSGGVQLLSSADGHTWTPLGGTLLLWAIVGDSQVSVAWNSLSTRVNQSAAHPRGG